MGCGQSKVGVAPGVEGHGGTPTKKIIDRPNSKTIRVKASDNTAEINLKNTENNNTPVLPVRKSKSGRLIKENTWTGSQDSLGCGGDTDSVRGSSATSKFSHHSCDSGFDDNGYENVITESSNANAVKEIEDEFNTPRNLDLGVVGTACQQRLSAKDRDRTDEQRVLLKLRSEGLIARPVTRVGNYASFEVVELKENPSGNSFLPPINPPARLAKLEKRKKKKKPLTEEQIQEKLRKAEERRKELEQQRLNKIQSVTNHSDVLTALDSFAERQKVKGEVVKSKEEIAAENRKKQLLELQAKLKSKQEHAEKVRQRKLAAAQTAPGDNMIPAPKIDEDTPIGVAK